MWPFSSNTHREVVDTKRAQRDEALSSAPSYHADAPTYDVYLRATASEIVTRIESGEWTSSQVVAAYCARAAYAQATTNCVTEVLFEQALREAALLDKEYAATGKLRGPLHGVPVSFKDQFNLAGFDSTIGFTQWANKPSLRDCTLAEKFRAAGAIIIVKTNVPQTMLAFECSNPLWGRTLNPHNDAYTCGGSSGGEAALLAMDGSVIGIGSDVGGSLRIPTTYCGIYALKPTAGRMTSAGTASPNPGFDAIRSAMGPMSRSVADLELASRFSFGTQDPIHDTPPVPYRDVELPPKLRFGYYTSDGYIKASPACKRAVLETVEALRSQGHECIEFEPPRVEQAFEAFVALTSADGYKRLTSHLGPDPQASAYCFACESSLFLVTLGPRLPGFLRSMASWVIRSLLGDSLFAGVLGASRVKPVAEFVEWCSRRDDYKKLWYKEVWGEHNFDGIIAPVQAVPCIPHGGCATMSPLAIATILYNMVDSPVGVVPVTHVDPTKDQLTDEWVHGPGLGSKLLEGRVYKGKDAIYNPEKMKGLPVAVQIVGRRWDDEKVIGMMHVVDAALGPRGFGPHSWKQQVKSTPGV
ncbi:hypothetical protein PLICRDRAFT_113002 [Plicaturopsis crispa FD-325 SS-3]|nr:hypothetical protein PLICRDRAFT_113002 [Plicaturopsis crispa FD-325 SS-3]